MEKQPPENMHEVSSPEIPHSPTPLSRYSKLVLFGLLSVLVIAGFVGTGYIWGAKTFAPINPKISPTPTPSSTAHWNSYTDPDGKFSFKYPLDWQTVVVSHSNNVVVTTAAIATQIKAHSAGSWTCPPFYPIKIKETVSADGIGVNSDEQMSIPSLMTIHGKSANAYTITTKHPGCAFDSGHGIVVFITVNNKAYQISLTNSDNPIYKAVFDTLLTTLTFSPAASEMPTPISVPSATYKDSYLGYSISYPKTWVFRRTFGPDIEKDAPTDIVSGFDLTYNTYVGTTPYTQATIVVNVLDSHDLTDIQRWIDTYDINYPKNADKTAITFHGLPALKFTNTSVALGPAEYYYLLSGKYAYRFSIAQKDIITDETRSIVDSFLP